MISRREGEPESEFERAFRPEHEVAEEQEFEARLQQERANIRAAFLRMQMENPLFREWLMELLNGFSTFAKPYGISPNGFPDHAETEYRQGLRAAGQFIWEMMDTAEPELASLMRREARGKP